MEKQIEIILTKLAAADKAGKLPQVINLSVYESDEDLKYFRPNEIWRNGAFEHKGYMIDIAAAIKRSYPQISVKLVPLNRKEYDEWRNKENLPENEATRAQFISLKTEN